MAVDPQRAQEHLDLLDGIDYIAQPFTFQLWLDVQLSLQKSAMNNDPTKMISQFEQGYFMLWNSWALVTELHEMMDEFPWKPWASTASFDRAAFVREAADALHFFGNLMLAVNVTGEELSREYLKKNRKNLERQMVGYNGKLEKCGYCGRELSDADPLKKVEFVKDSQVIGFCDLSHYTLQKASEES